MKITICIGSSCHLKGSRQIVEELQRLVAANNVGDKVELAGQFCTIGIGLHLVAVEAGTILRPDMVDFLKGDLTIVIPFPT